MTAAQLLRLYPRDWQERYGEEFLATVGDDALRFQQVIDIVSGAIDARFSSEVRRTLRGSTSQGDVIMNRTLSALCHTRSLRMTTRDSVIGAVVMIGASLALAVLGIFAKRSGAPGLGEFLTSLAFPASLVVSMPFTFLKGQPWKAQAAICGGTLLILVAATYVATLI